MSSVPVAERGFGVSVDCSYHICEVVHANVHTRCVFEQTVVEFLFIGLCVLRRITDRLPVLLLSIAPPHSVNGLLACQEVASVLFEHLSVADFHSDSVVLALLISVTQEPDLSFAGDDRFDFKSELVLGALLLLVVEGVEVGFVVESLGQRRGEFSFLCHI